MSAIMPFIISGLSSFSLSPHHAFHHHFTAFVIHQNAHHLFDIISSLAIVFMISVLLSDFEST
jgi:hypothetical protein